MQVTAGSIEIRASALKHFLLAALIVSLGIVSAGLVLPGSPINEYGQFLNDKARFAAYVFTALTVLGLPSLLMRLLRAGDPAVIISPEGFSAYPSGTRGLVPWRYVDSIVIWRLYGNTYVKVELTDEGWRKAPVTGLVKASRHIGKLTGGNGVNIAMAVLSVSAEELQATMEAYRIASIAKVEARLERRAGVDPGFYPAPRHPVRSPIKTFGRR